MKFESNELTIIYYLPFRILSLNFRSIDSEHVEVLHTSLKIGDPKTYRPGYLVKKHEKLDAQLVTSSPKQNFRANPIGQGLKQLLISGDVAASCDAGGWCLTAETRPKNSCEVPFDPL